MKTLVTVLALALAGFAAPGAFAKDMTPQQAKMKSCNTEATGKKGDERKAFMKTCLSADAPAAAAAPATQQEKMKSCNVDAKGKKGDERKAFMKECLSNKA